MVEVVTSIVGIVLVMVGIVIGYGIVTGGCCSWSCYEDCRDCHSSSCGC